MNAHPDIAGLLRDATILRDLGAALAEPFRDQGITAVVAPEARGPIIGSLVAVELGAGLVLARKADRNHPGADIPVEALANWTGDREVFQGRSFDLDTNDRVIVVDDWITTGNTIRAVCNIIRLVGATYAGTSVIVNKSQAETLEELRVQTLVDFTEIVGTT